MTRDQITVGVMLRVVAPRPDQPIGTIARVTNTACTSSGKNGISASANPTASRTPRASQFRIETEVNGGTQGGSGGITPGWSFPTAPSSIQDLISPKQNMWGPKESRLHERLPKIH